MRGLCFKVSCFLRGSESFGVWGFGVLGSGPGLQALVGFCPEHNIGLDYLTPREQVRGRGGVMEVKLSHC